MKSTKVMFTQHSLFILTMLLALPACAQVKTDSIPQANRTTRLENAVERAVATQQAQNCTCRKTATQETKLGPLDEDELIAAEEELQHLRNVKDSNATFEKYPYLLDPAYRRRQPSTPCQVHKPAPASVQEQAPLDTRELIEAEEELQHLRNVQDFNATFEEYPYLLSPAYRRGNAQTRQAIISRFRKSQSTWARKVGI